MNTLSQFLNSSYNGFTGSQGIQGFTGSQGIGFTGSQGIQGIQGFTGSSGSGGGGGSLNVGDTVVALDSPTSGTWLETGKYYSKSAYPTLAAAIGNIPDLGESAIAPQAIIKPPFTASSASSYRYATATNGTVTVIGGSGGYVYATTDGLNWNPVSSRISSNITEVRYLNNRFVIVSQLNAVMHSADGYVWELSNTASSSTSQAMSIAYGAGVYVLVGTSGTIMYSSDLYEWFNATGLGAVTLNRVIFDNGTFVAIPASGTGVMTSTDGITWNQRNSGSSATYNDIIYANNLFVAISTSSIVTSSNNGVSWTFRTSGSFNHITYANGVFVAVGNKISISSDGISWTDISSPANVPTTLLYNYVKWDGSKFIIAGSTQGYYLTSTNGQSWTAFRDATLAQGRSIEVVNGKTIFFGLDTSAIIEGHTRTVLFQSSTWSGYSAITNGTPTPRRIAYNGTNLYVAVGGQGAILTSSDAVNWTARPVGSSTSFTGIFYVGDVWIALGETGLCATSSNGVDWTVRTGLGSAPLNSAAFGAGIYVIVSGTSSTGTGIIYSSTDLVTWTARQSGTIPYNDIIFANNLFVAVGGISSTTAIFRSTDGISWLSAGGGNPATTGYIRIIYQNSTFIAVGYSGRIVTSSDGSIWTSVNSSGNTINNVTWNGTVYIAVGASGLLLVSSNLTTWTAITLSGFTTNALSVAAGNGKIIIVGSAQVIQSTNNGSTWTRLSTAIRGPTISFVTYLGNKFIATGASGTAIMSSTDGDTWTMNEESSYAITTGINRLYKLGSYYYAATSNGLFYSTDGASFNPVRTIPYVSITGVAYNGSYWITVVSSQANTSPMAVYKSTDGINWLKSTDIGTLTSTGIGTSSIADVEYVGSNFIITGTLRDLQQNIHHNIYTSPDSVTWTGRPLIGNYTPTGVTASDGTDILIAATISGNTSIFRSSNGGVTWSFYTTSATNTILSYSNNVWFVNGMITTNLSTKTLPTSGFLPGTGIYVYDNKYAYTVGGTETGTIISIGSAIATFFRNVGSTNVIKGFSGNNTASKPYPIRNNTILVPGSTPTSTNPVLIAEINLYSYDTSTTFYIPVSSTGGGWTTYVYAGE